MKILITGITGFLGSKLVDLLEPKFEIIGITSQTNDILTNKQIKLYNKNNIKSINEKPDVVILCHAAISSGNEKAENNKLYEANVQFTEQMVNMFPNTYLIYISSVSVYGNNSKVVRESSLLNPESEYAISKMWGEKTLCSLKNYGILRLSSLYGTDMKINTILPIYVNQSLKFRKIEVWGKGERKQNYFHVNDAVSYIEKMIQNKSQGIYLGTSEKSTSNIELAQSIKLITGADIVFLGRDNSISKTFNNSISREKLNIVTEIKLSKGLEEYITWKKRQF